VNADEDLGLTLCLCFVVSVSLAWEGVDVSSESKTSARLHIPLLLFFQLGRLRG